MRIAFVVPDDATAWLYYRQLIGELVRRGAKVTVISATGPWVTSLTQAGVAHVPVRYERFIAPFADIRLFADLTRIFRRGRFDVVQNFTVKANLYGAAAAALSDVPVIINTVEGAGILWSGDSRFAVKVMRFAVERGLRALRNRVSLYWFVNNFDRDLYVAHGLASDDRSVVAISTGVDTDEFSLVTQEQAGGALRHELTSGTDAQVVTMVAGRLLASKGIESFLEVARRLREGPFEVQCILVGPEERGHPDALPDGLLSEAVASGTIKSLGFRTDVPAIYAASDVVVVPTTYPEGIAKSVVEPMAMECPVVCSRTPAIAEVVTDGSDGILVKPGDVAAMTESILRILGDRRMARNMGRAARDTVIRRYDAAEQSRLATQTVFVNHLGLDIGADTRD